MDVGCGFGFALIEKFLQGYSCYGIDLDKSRIDKLRKISRKYKAGFVLKVANAQRLPFKSNFFDEAICSHLIEHVKNDEGVLKEIFRILKPNGKLFLRVPNVNNLHTKFRSSLGLKNHFTDRTHLREYSQDGITILLGHVGFKISNLKSRGFFFPVGLRMIQLLGNYFPIEKVLNPIGVTFPKNSAEFVIVCSK